MRCFLFFLIILFASGLSAQETLKKKNGHVIIKNDNGIVTEQGDVKKHLREGLWTKYYDTGERKEEVTYAKGVMNGAYRSYAKDATLKKEGLYTNGLPTGEWKHYDFAGRLVFIKQYNTNGELLSSEKYASGKITERSTTGPGGYAFVQTYNPDGSLHKRYTTVNDKLEGTYYEYSGFRMKGSTGEEDTLPLKIIHYHNGHFEGSQFEWQMFAGKRVLHSETWYKNDRMDSVYRNYFPAEHIMRECYYKNEKKDGIENTYTDSVLTARAWYTEGRCDSAYEYYKNGKVKLISNTHYRRKYYPDGKLEEDVTLGKWGVEGPVTDYYPNGKKKYELNYSMTAANGEWKAWNENGVLVIHAWANRFADTLEYVYSNKGKKLQEKDTAYAGQLKRYMPGMIISKARAIQLKEKEEEDIEPQEEGERDEGQDKNVFSYAEQMPEFPGGEGAYQEYLSKHLVFPEIEREAGKQGVVYVSFTVQSNGKITDVEAVKEVNGAPGFTKEAVRLIKGMPSWDPGKMNGRPVALRMTQPVRFKLD